MNLDITFYSYKKCKNKKCNRNQQNLNPIITLGHPISIAKFKECKDWKETKNVRRRNV